MLENNAKFIQLYLQWTCRWQNLDYLGTSDIIESIHIETIIHSDEYVQFLEADSF